jgi:hypothetical protein
MKQQMICRPERRLFRLGRRGDQLGADFDNLDEVVTDVAVEANEVPLGAGAGAGNAGEARRLPLWVFRA